MDEGGFASIVRTLRLQKQFRAFLVGAAKMKQHLLLFVFGSESSAVLLVARVRAVRLAVAPPDEGDAAGAVGAREHEIARFF